MTATVVFAATAVVLAVPLLVWSVASAHAPHRAALKNLRRGQSIADLRSVVLTRSAHDRALRPITQRLAVLAGRLTPATRLQAIERKLDLAGRPRGWTLERLLASRLVLALAGALSGGLLVAGAPGARSLLFAAVFTLAGYRTPDAILSHRAALRQEEIQRSLPDTIDQITVCVEAGLGFDAALSRVVETGSGPFVDELHRTLREMRVGASRARALAALAERTDAVELRRFVSAMQQAESYGLPVANMLRTHAKELRSRRRQRAEERALKVPVKLVFPLLFCVLPSLFIVTLGPAAIQVMQFMGGGGFP